MRKSWEFALAGTGTIGTAIFAPHERSLRLANMTAAFIVGVLAPKAEKRAGTVVGALRAFGSRAAAKGAQAGSAFSALQPAKEFQSRPTLQQAP